MLDLFGKHFYIASGFCWRTLYSVSPLVPAAYYSEHQDKLFPLPFNVYLQFQIKLNLSLNETTVFGYQVLAAARLQICQQAAIYG